MEHVELHDGRILRVHARDDCAAFLTGACPIHSPSDHPLRAAPLGWDSSLWLMTRLCPHGQEHSDPDSLAHWGYVFGAATGGQPGAQAVIVLALSMHACDGCCGSQPNAAEGEQRRPM